MVVPYQWHQIVVRGKLALSCHEYLRKGRQVFAEGQLRTREWEKNGQNNRRTEIDCTRVQFLGSPPRGGNEEVADEHPASDSATS